MASSSSSTLVIKVNYGDYMRRFSAQIINGKLSMTLNELRKKILSLFGFPLDKSIMVHYEDEDGDMVTLVDYDDLCDAVKQGLNPLRLSFGVLYEGAKEGPLVCSPYGSSCLPDHLSTKLCHDNMSNTSLSSSWSSSSSSSTSSTKGRLVLPQPTQKTTNGHSQSQKVMPNVKKYSKKGPSLASDGVENELNSLYESKSLYSSNSNSNYICEPIGNALARLPPPKFSSSPFSSISCSCCGVKPITGPIFKSKDLRLKSNDTLCNTCFQLHGKGMDYIRLDSPVTPDPHTKEKSSSLKLDASLVKELSVADGSILLPLTSCTKIWRMRNTGTIAWPQKTRLVWAGGYKLSTQVIELEIPAAGLPVGHELNVSVNFVSPSFRGEYRSYWRMSSPSGTTFGPHIWVHFKVEKSIKDLAGAASIEEMINRGSNSVPPAAPSTPNPTTQILDPPLSKATPVSEKKASNGASPCSSVSDPPKSDTQKLDVEQLILKLEKMGYKDFNLNMDILMKHNYGWDQTVEELSRVAKWDPLLEELDKMGFQNTELNVRLLKKNNGSIKRVVMDLLRGKDAED